MNILYFETIIPVNRVYFKSNHDKKIQVMSFFLLKWALLSHRMIVIVKNVES